MGDVIQVANADNKNSTVSKLVILRACLYDIHRDVRNLDQTHENNRQCDKRRTQFRAGIDGLMAANDKKQYQDKYANKKKAIMEEENAEAHYADWELMPSFLGGIACAILSAIVYTALILSGVILIPLGDNFLAFGSAADLKGFYLVVLGFLTGVAMGIGFGIASMFVLCLCSIVRAHIRRHREIRAEREDVLQRVRQVQSEEDEYFEKSGAYDQMVAQNNKKIEELRYKIKTENESITANNNKIRELQKAISRKWNSCVRVFSGVIHNSDYENLDYLLYLFITGRADTTKEALQLLDEAKRTEAIIGAINTAANYLASNFTSALNSLRNDVVRELKTINSSINSMHQTLSEGISTISGGINQINYNLAGIKESIDMNTVATMSFAISSRQMLSEINQKTTRWEYINGELVAR